MKPTVPAPIDWGPGRAWPKPAPPEPRPIDTWRLTDPTALVIDPGPQIAPPSPTRIPVSPPPQRRPPSAAEAAVLANVEARRRNP